MVIGSVLLGGFSRGRREEDLSAELDCSGTDKFLAD
jgi:hypothetical protein